MRTHFHPELQAAKYVVFVNGDGRYTDCSDGVCELVGYPRSEILAMKIENLSFERIIVGPLFEKYRTEGQQNGEYILRHKSGTPVLIRYRAWVFDDGCHAAVWELAEPWEQLFFAALIETDSLRLRDKVQAALNAIQMRQAVSGGDQNAELQQKLRDAAGTLRTLST